MNQKTSPTIVVKFGGSSLSTAEGMRRAANLLKKDPRRRYAVVSAPGIPPEAPTLRKITDLLGDAHDGSGEALSEVIQRFQALESELGFSHLLQEDLSLLPALAASGQRDLLLSRGEYLCAKLFAALTERPFLDTANLILFDDRGRCRLPESVGRLRKALASLETAILPGFYGSDKQGQVRLFSRGGSDTTGSLLAAASEAILYENRTDVDGIYAADPRLFRGQPSPPLLRHLSYARAQELTRLGFGVLQEDSLRPVMEADIPLRLCSSQHPDEPGTLLSLLPAEPEPYCFAGKGSFSLLRFDAGYLSAILQESDEKGIPLRGLQIRENSLELILPESAVAEGERSLSLTLTKKAQKVYRGQALLTATGPLGARRLLAVCESTGAPLRFFKISPSHKGDFARSPEDQSFLRDAPFRESPLLCTDEEYLPALLSALAGYF